jgi:ribosomal protein S18 acetylase RimI-like enzyme
VIRVRDATLDDAEAIVELTAAGWRAAYPGIVPDAHLAKLPISAWRHDIRAGLDRPARRSFTKIAELNGVVAGYCFVAAPGRDEPDESRIAEVVAIYVDPRSWRRGVGRELLAAAAHEAEDRGFDELTLWSFERNERALRFYEALGWELQGARKPHEPTGAPTVRLRIALGDAAQ